MSTIIQKWEKIGVLESVPDDRKEIVANGFEFILQTLINREKPKQFETISFPIIQRILMKIDILEKDMLEIIDNCSDECKIFVETTELKHNPNIDIEAEFIADYVDNYLIKRGHKGFYKE